MQSGLLAEPESRLQPPLLLCRHQLHKPHALSHTPNRTQSCGTQARLCTCSSNTRASDALDHVKQTSSGHIKFVFLPSTTQASACSRGTCHLQWAPYLSRSSSMSSWLAQLALLQQELKGQGLEQGLGGDTEAGCW